MHRMRCNVVKHNQPTIRDVSNLKIRQKTGTMHSQPSPRTVVPSVHKLTLTGVVAGTTDSGETSPTIDLVRRWGRHGEVGCLSPPLVSSSPLEQHASSITSRGTCNVVLFSLDSTSSSSVDDGSGGVGRARAVFGREMIRSGVCTRSCVLPLNLSLAPDVRTPFLSAGTVAPDVSFRYPYPVGDGVVLGVSILYWSRRRGLLSISISVS